MMKNPFKKIRAFTLAEVTVVLVIIGLIATLMIKYGNKKANYYVNKYMSYAALTTLQNGVTEMLVQGCLPTDLVIALPPSAPMPICAVPTGVIPEIANDIVANRGFCNRLSDMFNITGSPDCTAIANDGTNFATATPNFVTANGLKFFNLGTDSMGIFYTVYIDIDGSRNKGELNKDVMKFTVNVNGTVLPSFDSQIATNPNYLTASVRYPIQNSPNFQYVATGVNYLTAVCDAKGAYFGTACSAASTAIYNSNCLNNNCEVVINKPKAPLF